MAPQPSFSRVPTIAQVVPGAYVNIVLKQDQPTGRTVQGMVQNVLTRGNHPRGIKVRLSDGRVGRVQTMSDSSGASASAYPAAGAASSITSSAAAAASGSSSFYSARGVEDEVPQEQLGLDAFIKPAKPRQNKRRGGGVAAQPEPVASSAAHATSSPQTATATTATTTTTCPVCGDFEGDEAAVSHHVSSHFDA